MSVAVPLLTNLRLDIPCGSSVTVETRNDGTLIGEVYQNPATVSTNQTSFVIQLINVIKKDGGEKIEGSVTLYERDIVQVTLIKDGSGQSHNSLKKQVCESEIFMMTHVINAPENLRQFLAQLRISQVVSELGCVFKFEPLAGIQKPKKLTWIILCVQSVLVSINMKKINEEVKHSNGAQQHWKKLGSIIFSNENICKVFYNCQSAAQYLYVIHGIRVNNVFDIMLAEKFIIRNKKGSCKIPEMESERDNFQTETISLADLLSKYLCSVVQPQDVSKLRTSEEAKANKTEMASTNVSQELSNYLHLEHVFGLAEPGAASFSTSASLQNFLKGLALEVKYLLHLKMEMEKQILKPLENLSTFRMEVITNSNNATAHGFLSTPEHIGNHIRYRLEHL